MTQYALAAGREFAVDNVVGHPVPRAMLWDNGFDIQTSIVRMNKGDDLGRHRHDTWLQVFILSGSVHCSVEDRVCVAGDFYMVEPGDEHVERCIEDAEILLIKSMPNIQCAVED